RRRSAAGARRLRARSDGPSAPACVRCRARRARGRGRASRLCRRRGRRRRVSRVPHATSPKEPFLWRGRRGRRDRAFLPAPFGGLGYPAGMTANRVIGVDLGGTKILAGIVDEGGKVHEMVERPTVTTSQGALLDELAEVVRTLPQDGVGAVGFGIPTRVDAERGMAVGAAVNVPVRDVPFRDEMQ